MTEYTPEKVAELITEAREKGRNNISKGITLNDRLADALTAVSAERDTAIRDLDAGFAESDHLSAKYYQRMRDAERELGKERERADYLDSVINREPDWLGTIADLNSDLARAREVISRIDTALRGDGRSSVLIVTAQEVINNYRDQQNGADDDR